MHKKELVHKRNIKILGEWNKEYSSIIEWVELSNRQRWPDSYATTQISDKLPLQLITIPFVFCWGINGWMVLSRISKRPIYILFLYRNSNTIIFHWNK